mmetsp:Transcript_68538/g.222037  ORF Transcript_68538/g.222037 Transcript_68538/m.222037 type:complete len:202 (-) Transcript_68538:599-1204(-)
MPPPPSSSTSDRCGSANATSPKPKGYFSQVPSGVSTMARSVSRPRRNLDRYFSQIPSGAMAVVGVRLEIQQEQIGHIQGGRPQLLKVLVGAPLSAGPTQRHGAGAAPALTRLGCRLCLLLGHRQGQEADVAVGVAQQERQLQRPPLRSSSAHRPRRRRRRRRGSLPECSGVLRPLLPSVRNGGHPAVAPSVAQSRPTGLAR